MTHAEKRQVGQVSGSSPGCDAKCRACGAPGTSLVPVGFSAVATSDHDPSWFRCAACKSYVASGLSTPVEIAGHHRAREWGSCEHPAEYAAARLPLHRHILLQAERKGITRGRLLDVGTSYGGMLAEGARKGFSVRGTEANAKCVAYLAALGYEVTETCSLAPLADSGEKFDLITLVDMVYYLADQERELSYVYRLLKPGGWACIRTTNKLWMVRLALALSAISRAAGRRLFRVAVYDHKIIQAPRSLKSVLQACGFDKIVVRADAGHRRRDKGLAARLLYGVSYPLSQIIGGGLCAPGVLVWAKRPRQDGIEAN